MKTQRPRNRSTHKRSTAFSIRVNSYDGHESYSIVYDAIDTVIASIPYFMPQDAAKSATETFLDALNTYYREGGYFPNIQSVTHGQAILPVLQPKKGLHHE